MKRIIFAIAIIIGISGAVNAQTSSKHEKKEKQKMEMKDGAMKDGVMMMDNKAMLCSKDKCTPLSTTYTCTDGCKVSTDGTITKPDGTTMKLMNGYKIDKDGKVAMIAHGQKGHVCDANCPMHSKM